MSRVLWSQSRWVWHGYPRTATGFHQHQQQSCWVRTPGTREIEKVHYLPSCWQDSVEKPSGFYTQSKTRGLKTWNGLTACIHGNTQTTKALTVFWVNWVCGLFPPELRRAARTTPSWSSTGIQSFWHKAPSSVSKRGIWKTYQCGWRESWCPCCRLHHLLLTLEGTSSLSHHHEANDWPLLDVPPEQYCYPSCRKLFRGKQIHHHQGASPHCPGWEKLLQVNDCRESVRAHFTISGEFQPPSLSSNITPNTNDIKVHYSFDYAQQVHFPSDPLQPGPINFLTPRKCTVFGVNCDALPRQVNFLTDEAGECGKGANNVVSRLHYFLETHRLSEKVAFLHADNCTGQNKNNCMVQDSHWSAHFHHTFIPGSWPHQVCARL